MILLIFIVRLHRTQPHFAQMHRPTLTTRRFDPAADPLYDPEATRRSKESVQVTSTQPSEKPTFKPVVNNTPTSCQRKPSRIFDKLFQEAALLQQKKIAVASANSFVEERRMWDGLLPDRGQYGPLRAASPSRSPWVRREVAMAEEDAKKRTVSAQRRRAASPRPLPRVASLRMSPRNSNETKTC